MVTNRFMLSAFLLIIPLFSFSTTGESNVVVLLKSDVYIPPVRGDPGRVTPLMALIELSGGEVTNCVLDAHGRYQFAKSVGPFKYIDVRMNRDVKPLWTFYEPFKDGGMVTQVVSRVTCYEPTFETAVKKIKEVKNVLAREARIYSFVKSGKPDVDSYFKTESPTFGGWIIAVGVRCVSANNYEYTLTLERNIKNIGREMPEVPVEVDL